jgi:hypothetical protein
MRIKARITREDINKGEWNAHYGPEALAIRRSLREAGIGNFFSVRVADKGRVTFWFPGALKDDKVPVLQASQRVKGLGEWTRKALPYFNGGFVNFINHVNPKFNGRSRDEIPEHEFEVRVPEDLRSAPDFSWLIREIGEPGIVNSTEIPGISEYGAFNRLEEKWKDRVHVEWLQRGELARRDLDTKNTFYVDRRGKKRSETSEILIPTMEFEERELDAAIRKALRHEKKPGFVAGVWFRCFYEGKIEAGIAWGHNG